MRCALAGHQSDTALLPAAVKPKTAPMWHVVLLDDDDHTYDYVIEMLCEIFRHTPQIAYRMACEVDMKGRVIVLTAPLEVAELKRDLIHSYGADWRLERSRGSMTATLEPSA